MRTERTRQGLTIIDLSRMADLDPGHLSKFERGLRGSSDESRIAIARALGVQVADLFPYPDTTR